MQTSQVGTPHPRTFNEATKHHFARISDESTRSSWLNQVERWFGLLTDKRLRRGTHTRVPALEKDIRDWITTWNENPKPFAWTKTADEILERLATYLQRIPGAGH